MRFLLAPLAPLALLVALGMAPAIADGLSPSGPLTPGRCFASGTSGPTVPCVQEGRTWTRVLRPADPADGMTVLTEGATTPAIMSRLLAATGAVVRADIPFRSIPASVTSLTLSGHSTVGDGCQGAVYTRGPGLMQITDALGSPWHLVPGSSGLWFECFGGKMDNNAASAAGNDAAWDAVFNYARMFQYGAQVNFGSGTAYFLTTRTTGDFGGRSLRVSGRGKRATRFLYAGASPTTLLSVRTGPGLVGDQYIDDAGTTIEGIEFASTSGAANNGAGSLAIDVYGRSGILIRDIKVVGYKEGIKFAKSYGPHMTDVVMTGIAGRAIQTAPDGTANGMVLHKVAVTNSGNVDKVPAVDIVGGGSGNQGNGMSVIGSDFESGYINIQFTNMFGVAFVGNYSETSSSANSSGGQNIAFSGKNAAFNIAGNWFGEQTNPLTFANLKSSSVTNNTFYNTTIAFDVSATDLDFGNYALFGAASVTNATPWTTVAPTSGCANIGGSYEPLGYRRHADGSIEIKGGMTCPVPPSAGPTATPVATVFTTLPVGYRPFKHRTFVVPGLVESTGNTEGISVDPNGNVTAFVRNIGGYIDVNIRFTP